MKTLNNSEIIICLKNIINEILDIKHTILMKNAIATYFIFHRDQYITKVASCQNFTEKEGKKVCNATFNMFNDVTF